MGNESRLNPGARDFTGPAVVLEARGRELKEGDEIIVSIPGPIYFRVAGIQPILDPSAPPGLVQVHVGAMLTFGATRGKVNREFVRVRTAEEAGPAGFKLLDAQPTDEAPTPAESPAPGPRLVTP